MRFESPYFLLLLLIIPGLLYYYFFIQTKRTAGVKFSSIKNIKILNKTWKIKYYYIPFLIRILAIIFLILALARPQMGRELIKDITKGIAIMITIDRSGSMQAEMEYFGKTLNRLEVVKKVVEEFVNGNKKGLPGRPNDLIGLVAFARYAETVCPLTLSHNAINEFLKTINLATKPEEDGTSIGDAIALAAARLRKAEEELSEWNKKIEKTFEIKSKVIILLTDGQNNFGKRTPLEAARLAKEWGIKIYTIGIGGKESFINVQTFFGTYKMPVSDTVDEETLKIIAQETGGKYFLATDMNSLRNIYKEIDSLEKKEIEVVRYMDYKETYIYFAIIAFILLIIEFILNNTIFRKIP